MRKTENRTQQNGAPAARRRRGPKALAVLALAAALAALLAAGQQVRTMAQKDESLFNRMERSVKTKEPSWKLVQKDERKGAQESKYFTQEWELEEEYVSTTTYQMSDAEYAAQQVAEFIRTPTSVPLRVEKVPGLGDEAYTLGESPYGKKGAGTLIARLGNVVIRIDTSSLQAAKRFARHMLDEVEAN